MLAYLNGHWLDEERAAVSIDDPGLLTGDGAYETARLHRGRYFRLDRHLDRFEASAAVLRIPVPDAPELRAIAERLVRENDLVEATLRFVVTRGAAPMTGPTLFATLRPLAPAHLTRAERGWSIVTASTRRPPVGTLPASFKGLGRTYAVLARLEANAAGADDALLLSADGDVAEGPAWNVFWRRGRTLFTPPADIGVLDGVTRSVTLELAGQNGFGVKEVVRPRAELDDAEEIFATMSSVGIVTIRALDGRPLESDAAARLLNGRYWDLVGRECRPETE